MITIYHNPNCGTSRNTLAMIRQSGEEPEIIDYIKNPASRARLIDLIKAMNMSVRALLRGEPCDTPFDGLRIRRQHFHQGKQRPACHDDLTLRMFDVTARQATRIVFAPPAICALLRHQPLGCAHVGRIV